MAGFYYFCNKILTKDPHHSFCAAISIAASGGNAVLSDYGFDKSALRSRRRAQH
jgi:hypothetical protein